MKVDYIFVEKVKETLNSAMCLDEYGCFSDLEVQPDEDTIEDGVVYEYTVTFKYSTLNAEDIEICFNVCKSEDSPGYIESRFGNGDFAVHANDDIWQEVSYHTTEPLWFRLIEQLESYYQSELKEK